jgi:hypothetical protein
MDKGVAMKYKVRTSKGEYGPVKGKKLRLWAMNGRITPNDLVRPMNQKRWYRADAIGGLFGGQQINIDGIQTHRDNFEIRSKPSFEKRKSPRLFLILLMFIIPIIAIFVPKVSFWSAGIFVAVLLFHAMPATRRSTLRVLRISAEHPVQGGLKIAFLWFYSGLLIASGFGSIHMSESRREYQAQRAAEEAEEQRIVAEANNQVDILFAEIDSLLTQGDVQGAKNKISQATAIRKSTKLFQISRLAKEIEDSSDPAIVFERLVRLGEMEFSEFRQGETIPATFAYSYDILTAQAMAIAKMEIDRAIVERANREKRNAEALEERRRLDEERRLRDIEETERKEKLEEEKVAAANALKAKAQKELQDRLDAYMAVLESAEVRMVDSVAVRRIGDETWEATLTVQNLWHLRHKQLRLQDAQTLWEVWARIASPNNLDSARIVIVDQNGNKVGGSRVWGGSLIWVDD